MARIEWQPLAIPDIGDSALRAQQASANSIRGAFQDLNGVLDQWKGQRRDAILGDLTRQQLQFQDPNDFKTALGDGRINLNSDYLRPEDMMRVAGYEDTLRTRRNSERSYVRDEQEYKNRQEDRTELKANTAQGLIVTRAVASAQADLAANRITQAQYDEITKPLLESATTAGHIEVIVRGRTSGIQESRDADTFERGRRDSNYNYNRRVEVDERDDTNYQEKEDAQKILDELTRNGGSIIDLERQENFINATPGTRAEARLLAQQLNIRPGSEGNFSGPAEGDGSDTYGAMLVTLESAGNPNAQPRLPNGALASSAVGLHQFTRDTWLSTVKGNFPWARGKTDAELLALRTNPEYSSQAERALRNANQRRLVSANLPVNNVNLYAMHHFSPSEALAFARAGGNTPTARLFSPSVIAANPYLRGRTKDEVIAHWDARTNGAASRNASRTVATVAGASVANANDRTRYMASPAFLAALNGEETYPAVVARLRGEGGAFRDMSNRQLGGEIRKIQERYASQNSGAFLPPAAAALIFENSLKPYNFGRDIFGQMIGQTRVGQGRSLNNSDIDQSLALIRPDGNGRLGLADSMAAAQGRASALAQTPAMRAELEGLRAQIRQMELRDTAPGGNPNNPVTARLRQQASRLQYTLDQQFASNEEALNPPPEPDRPARFPSRRELTRFIEGR